MSAVEVLAKHSYYVLDNESGWYVCQGCKTELETRLPDVPEEFREHQVDMLREAGLLAEGAEWGYARIPCAIVSMPSEDIAREVAGQHGGYISIMRRAVGPWVEVP